MSFSNSKNTLKIGCKYNKRIVLYILQFHAICSTSRHDEVLLESAEERRRDREGEASEPVGVPPLAPEELLVPMTKESCLAFFQRHGYPDATSPGSLWGTYLWAADLGRAKFFPDVEFNEEGLNILNAYI